MIWPGWTGEEPVDEDIFDCPFCSAEGLDWSDACLFGCLTCGATFWEETQDAIEFTPEAKDDTTLPL